MKKISYIGLCGLILSLHTVNAFANIEIHTKNISNDAKIFVFPFNNVNYVFANNLGAYAVVSNQALSHIPQATKMSVGVDTGVNIIYCQDEKKRHQFIFNLDNNMKIELTFAKTKCGHSYATCKII